MNTAPDRPKYPGVVVTLTGTDGNAAAIVQTVIRHLRREGIPRTEQMEYRREALAGDYEHLLMVTERWVHVR